MNGRGYRVAVEPLISSSGAVAGFLAVALSHSHYNRLILESMWSVGGSAALGIALAFVLAWVASRRLGNPIRELSRSALRIAEGNLDQKVVVPGAGEIDGLVTSFNAMAAALKDRDAVIRRKSSELQGLNERLNDLVGERTAELETEKSRLEAILTSLSDGVVVTDSRNSVVLANPAAHRLLGLLPAELTNRPLESLSSSEGFQLLVSYIEPLSGCLPNVSEVQETFEAGGRQIQALLSPLLSRGGEFGGVVVSLRDITGEREISRMKDDFMRAVSHELKTPLTAMTGSLQLLLAAQEIGLRERELLDVCRRNTDRLAELTAEILKATSGSASAKKGIELKRVPVSVLLEHALQEVFLPAQEKRVAVSSALKEGADAVYGDADKLRKVVANLLFISIFRQAEGGEVRVAAARKGNYVRFTIRGSAAENGAADPNCARYGVPLCREIVKAHHGHFEDNFIDGEGFSFTLPACEEP